MCIASTSRQTLLPRGESDEARLVAVKRVRVAALRVLGVVLPHRLIVPPGGRGAGGVGVPGQPERAAVGEGGAVARALRPPVERRVDEGPARRLPLVRRHEVLDPVHHGRLREPVARVPARVVLDVQCPRERDAVARPPAAVGREVLGLRRPRRRRRLREVVRPADQPRLRRPVVLLAEQRALVARALGGLFSTSKFVLLSRGLNCVP